MSGNQKQAPSGAPQQQRYPQGPDAFHVTTQPTGFVPQQTSNQPNNQGPTIRGMAQTGPPNQSSTPPQNELKGMQPQPGQLPITFMPRTGQPSTGYYRPPPNQGGPRMSNHHRQTMTSTPNPTQPIYTHQMSMYPSPMGQMTSYPMPVYHNTRPQTAFYPPTQFTTILPSQYLQSAYPTQQPQASPYYYQNAAPITMTSRQVQPPQVAPAPQAGGQPTQQTMPMPPPMTQHNTKKRHRAKAIPIINPTTGKEIIEEEESQPPSGESSARETPQPPLPSSMIPAEFAARVAIVASEDKEPVEQPEPIHPVPIQSMTYGPSSQQQQQQSQQHHNAAPPHIHAVQQQQLNSNIKENDVHHKVADSNLAQNSKLQASTKEFIPEVPKHNIKETTPVVSANTEGVEVTLQHSKSRERDSPAKSRRQQQQQQQQQHLHQQQPLPQRERDRDRGERADREKEIVSPKEPPVSIVETTLIVKESVVVTNIAAATAIPTTIVVHSTHEQIEAKAKLAAVPAPPPPAVAKAKSVNDNKGPTVVPLEHRPPIGPQTNSVALADDNAANLPNAKNKGSAQKSKENSAPIPNQQQSAKPNMPVPGSQPPKPSSKANKMRELNMKGASKEGTDMDAFNTAENAQPIENHTNNDVALKENVVVAETPVSAAPVQVQPAVVSQPQQQAPLQPPPQQQQQQAPPPPQVTTPQQKLPDAKSMPKPKVDVTSIVKEAPPRAFKPAPQPPQPITQQQQQPATDPQDETDRAASDKLVQVKNEANNIKTNASENSDTQVIDKTVIRYKKDQWSPLNIDGKKCYDRDFLLCLQNNPKSKKKPDNLPDLEVVLKDNNRSKIDIRSFQINRQTEVLMPAFHKSASQRGPLPKRNSQQGKAGMKGGKPNTIHVSLSLREDVKLRETENAWRPARLNMTATMTDDEMKTAELYKRVRGVLNKLTPEKFEKLLNQVRALTIDNAERLQGVIDLVFEKAVDEPNFSVAYALMCKELALMQVPANSKNKDDPEFVNFRKLLITRCQLEFEKNSVDENARNLKQKEIDECTDSEKKKELQLQLEDDDRRMRVKSVGNIRFIGELFKQQMLTVKIMLRCINILLENKDEDSLECLCKLLTTIGKDLETKGQSLSNFFIIMQEIVDKKHGRISSRVRFMLQDVIDLRSSKWVPRRQDLNPRTMEQIQKEADTEQLNIQLNVGGAMNTPRKDDRLGSAGGSGGGGGGGSDRKRRNNQPDDSGWSMATTRNRATPYTVEPSKLMNKPPPMEEITLGSKNLFGNWGRGSNIKTQQPHVTNTTNMYAALENINAEQEKSRSYESRLNKDPYVSKGHSMERSGYKQNYEDGRGSRSGSQHRNVPTSQQQKPTPAPAPTPTPSAPPPKQQLNPEQLKLRLQNILEEYVNDCCSLQDCETELRGLVDLSKMHEFVIDSYNNILERSTLARKKSGILFAHFVKTGLIPVEDLYKALRELLSQADDLVIDIPKLWDYLAEMVLPLVTETVVPLDKLLSCSDDLVAQGTAHRLFAPVLKKMVEDKGPNYVVDAWQTANLRFTDFIIENQVDCYVRDNKLEFLMGGAGTPVANQVMPWDQVHSKLLQFFESNTSFDTTVDWISANLNERATENQFIRTLVTAVFENAVMSVNNMMKLRPDILKNHFPLLQRYVDNQEGRELQCLFALQALVHKWEHPPGLLLSIFERLWEDGLLSNDSFLAWEKCNDPAELEGKGVALKSLQSLFTALKEVDDDDDASSASEEAA